MYSNRNPSGSSLRLVRARDAREWLAAFEVDAEPVALLLIGIRDLKQINERHGRIQGDAVIRNAGARIRQFVRGNDAEVRLLARLPGREFLLTIAGEDSERRLEMLARKLIDALSTDLGGAGEAVHISPRIGIAQGEMGEMGSELLHRASQALAKAYARKGKKLAFADPRGAEGSQYLATLEADLRDAIAARQITIMLQPQFQVSTGHLSGAEALARWHHPALGEIGAGQLFATADRCDLREELSHLIQQEAIGIAARWRGGLSDLRLSVNLGAEELNEGYSARLLGLLADAGFPSDRLTLELTEEGLVRDISQAAAQLELLRAQRISIALDDFGTGYSSLAYLKDLPLDYLKLDKGMTPAITGEGKERIVLRAIIAMGKALGLQIVAEGVERQSELDMLKAEGCDYFQGFLRSPPLSAAQFEEFALRSN